MIKLVSVSYANSYPFVYGIQNRLPADEWSLEIHPPSTCAELLLKGEADIGLVPVVLLADHPELLRISNFGIAANGEVETVKMYSSVPLDEIEKIHLDYQSRTSVQLCRVLAHYFWKINPDFLPTQPGYESRLPENDAMVVIGDRPFDLNGAFKYEWDLSEEWKTMTGKPFVFAAWIGYKTLDPNKLKDFEDAVTWGLARRKTAVTHFEKDPETQARIIHYTQEKIEYALSAQHLEGMQDFLKMVQEIRD